MGVEGVRGRVESGVRERPLSAHARLSMAGEQQRSEWMPPVLLGVSDCHAAAARWCTRGLWTVLCGCGEWLEMLFGVCLCVCVCVCVCVCTIP